MTVCPRCGDRLAGRSVLTVYCSQACKQSAYRKRQKGDAVRAFVKDVKRLAGPLGLKRGTAPKTPLRGAIATRNGVRRTVRAK